MKNGGKLCAALLSIMLGITGIARAAENTVRADRLKALGLFLGTDIGYELDRAFTREEGAAMLVRLAGAEKTALESEHTAVFEDVPAERWSYGYVMYCYENGITKGTGEAEFTPESSMPAEEYITFVLRLLGYKEAAPETAFEYAVEKGMLDTQTVKRLQAAESFLRDDMVYISYNALKTKTADGKILAYVLADKGVITVKEAEKYDITKTQSMNEMLEMFLN